MINRTLLFLQGNQYTIYNMVLLSRDRVSASPRVGCFSDYPPENTEQSLKSTTTIERHVPPITPMLSIPNAQKTAEALNETSKTDHRTAWKALKTAQKSQKQVKLNKIFLSHYQGVEVLDQKKDFKIFGQNRKRQYFCNPKRRGKGLREWGAVGERGLDLWK